jgi:hypothetical protein
MANPFFGVAKALKNRLFPDRNGPAGLQFTFPFRTNAVTLFEYQLQLQPVKLEWITGAFIDNATNAQPFNLLIGETGQQISIPANSQGFVELLGLNSDKVSITGRSTGNVDVNVTFTNYVPLSGTVIWSVLDPSQIIGTITVAGTVTALPTMSDSIDRSATVAAANVAQSLMAANPARKLFNIMNPYANANLANGGILTVSFSASKVYGQVGGYDIAPGGSFNMSGFGMPNEQIFIAATDAGAVVSAMEI